jgi:hypothetical protein
MKAGRVHRKKKHTACLMELLNPYLRKSQLDMKRLIVQLSRKIQKLGWAHLPAPGL